MYEFSQQQGYIKLTLKGHIGKEEMREWMEGTLASLNEPNHPRHVMVDLREMSVLPKESLPMLETIQRKALASGMIRSALIVKSAIIQMQFERIAKSTGIFAKERYFSAETTPNWEKAAEAWILHGSETA
jgi:hypothetical protein